MTVYYPWAKVYGASAISQHELVEPLACLVTDLRAEGRLEISTLSRKSVALRTKDQDLVSCGSVVFDDLRRRPTGAYRPVFHVFSERIRNPRFSSSSDRHHSRSAADIGKARTLVDQHIQPLSLDELFRVTENRFCSAMCEAERELRGALYSAVRPFIGYGAPNDTMVRLLLDVTSSPMLDTFTDAPRLREWRAAYEAYNQPEYQQGRAWFVHKRPLGYMAGELAISGKNRTYPSVARVGDPQHFTEAELPDVLRQRIAVMQVLDAEQYVPGVGIRLSSNVWYAYA